MIFEYHSLVPDSSLPERWRFGQALRHSDFERQIRWLKKHFLLLPLEDYLAALHSPSKAGRRMAALTFDDGYRSTFDIAASILAEHQIPAVFFVSTAHLEDGELLWFSYLKALCYEIGYERIEADENAFPLQNSRQRRHAWSSLLQMARRSRDPAAWSAGIAKRYPVTDRMAEAYRGMTIGQLAAAGGLGIELAAHTHTHPYLDKLPLEAQRVEIDQGKQILEKSSGRAVRFFAYPSGAYNLDSIALVKAAGFQAGFVEESRHLQKDWRFELPRTGIYSPRLWKFQLKALGASGIMSRLGFRPG